jgi:hypothetical protein
MKHVLVTACLLGGVPLLGSTTPDGRAEVADASAAVAAFELAMAKSACDDFCSVCIDTEEHFYNSVMTGGKYQDAGVGSHGCEWFNGVGCAVHDCAAIGGEGDLDIASLVDRLRRLSSDELRQVSAGSTRLILNTERAAFQLIGCNNQVLMTVNVSSLRRT